MLKRVFSMVMAIVMLSGVLTGMEVTAAAAARTVTVFKVQGSDVKMTKGTEKEFSVKENLKLYDGYTVSTGKDSYCQLKLDDGSLLKMNQRSKIKVSKASSNKLSISVLSGGLLVDAEKQKNGDEVEVRIGNSALAIRGTYFTAENGSEGSAVYTMFEGSGQVDGHDLPSGHIMDVYDNDGKNSSSGQSNQVHELTELEVNENSSIFVLETVLDDTKRFIENGTIEKKDISDLEKLLEAKRKEALSKDELAVIIGKTIYYEMLESGDYSGGLDLNAVTVDKTALQDALQLAYTSKKGVFVSDSGNKVDIGRSWVSKEFMDEFNAAIKNAENVLDAVVTVQQVRDEVTELSRAILRFMRAVNENGEGTRPVSVNTASLESVIAEAYAAKKGVFVNTAAENVEIRRLWVLKEEMKALNDAIAAAEGALNTMAVQQDITEKAAVLAAAVSDFNKAKQDGINLNPAVTSEELEILETVLAEAYATKNAILTSISIVSMSARTTTGEDGSGVDVGRFWVTQEDMRAINAAIEKAEDIFSTAVSLEEIEAAVVELKEAISIFDTAKKEGTRPLSLDRSVLQISLERAYDSKNEISISTNGEDVYLGSYWVTIPEMQAVSLDIEEAEEAYINAGTEQEIIEAANKLDKAVEVFNEAKKPGGKGLDFEELFYAISAAIEALDKVDGITIRIDDSYMGRETWNTEYFVTTKAYETLEDALDNAYKALSSAGSQMEIRNTVRDLEWETRVFNWSVSLGSKHPEQPETNQKVWRNTRTGMEYSSFMNATQTAKEGDTLELFADTELEGLLTSYPAHIIVNEGVTLEVGSLCILSFQGILENNGIVINNSLGFYILGGQTFINNGIFNNNTSLNVTGAEDLLAQGTIEDAEFINNGIFDNESGAQLIMKGIFNNVGTFNNKHGAEINIKGIDGRPNGTPTFQVIGEGNFVNDGLLFVGDGTIFDFSSGHPMVNNGKIEIGSSGKLIYRSANKIFKNTGTFSGLSGKLSGSNIEINTAMKLIGEKGAVIMVDTPITRIGQWDISNIYDESGNPLTQSVPAGSYLWNSDKEGWYTLDKSALADAIARAEAAKEGVVVSGNGDGSDVAEGARWVGAWDMMLMEFILGSAKSTLDNATKQQEIDLIEMELNTRIEDFTASIRIKLNKSGLEAAIKKAEDILTRLDPSELTTMFLNAAIENAKEVLATAKTQEEINKALEELNLQMKPHLPLETSALEAAIWKAEIILEGLDFWNAMFLSVGLNNAKEVLVTAITQDEIDEALAALMLVLAPFLPDTGILEAAIARAEDIKTELDPLDFGAMLLELAIGNAKETIATALTQEEVDEAYDDFYRILKQYLNLETSVLEEAIAKAELVIAGLDPFDFGTMLLNIAIGEAKRVLTTALTQEEVDKALADLNSILEPYLLLETSI